MIPSRPPTNVVSPERQPAPLEPPMLPRMEAELERNVEIRYLN